MKSKGENKPSPKDELTRLRKRIAELEMAETGHKRAEGVLHRVNRAYRMLSECNDAVLRAKNETDLLQSICECIIEDDQYRLAWVGYAMQNEEETVHPIAQSGYEDGYLETLTSTWEDTEKGKDPTSTVIRTGKPSIVRDIHNAAPFVPWRDDAEKMEYTSSIALPLYFNGMTIGALNIYSMNSDAFDENEVSLLKQLAGNISQGISTLRWNTERNEAEYDLKASESKLRDLYDNAPDMFAMVNAKTGIVTEVNTTLTLETGYSREEIMGKYISEMYHPDCENEMNQVFDQLITNSEIRNAELQLMHKDGSKIEVSLNVSAVRDEQGNIIYHQFIWRDFAAQKWVTRILKEQTHELGERIKELNCLYGMSKLIENSDIPIDEMLQSVVDLIPVSWQYPETTCVRIRIEEQSYHTENFRETIWAQTSDITIHGERVGIIEIYYLEEMPLLDEGPFLNEERALIGAVAERLGRFIERKQAEEKAREVEMLQEIDRMRSELLANVSHELKTPLTVIKGYTTMLLRLNETIDNDKRVQHLESIARASGDLHELIDNLLDMSRLQTGSFKLDIEPTSFSLILQELATDTVVSVPDHVLTWNLPNQLPLLLLDHKRIRQVIGNLIDNAAKYSPSGSEIAISVQKDESTLIVSVTDCGIGIPANEIDRVFERMYRVKSTKVTQTSGAGLGLPICKAVIEAHGGQIRIESEEDAGTTCFFTLPIDKITTNWNVSDGDHLSTGSG